MPPPRPSGMLRAALAYADRGIPVLPLHHPVIDPDRASDLHCSCATRDCASPAKHPHADLVPRGVTDATTDRATVASWWTRHPEANIGLATGHRFDVLDVDGPIGTAAVRELATAHELVSGGPLVQTGSGGWHYFWQPTGLGNPRPRDLAHVDWRGRGGYVVAPPSRHATGARYRFVRDLHRPIPAVPAALRARLERLLDKPVRPRPEPTADLVGHPYGLTALDRECDELAAATIGARNHRLFLAGLRLHSLAAGGVLEPDVIDQRLGEAGARCGLGRAEIERTLRSARRIAAQHPRGVPDLAAGSSRGRRAPRTWEIGRARDGRAGGRQR